MSKKANNSLLQQYVAPPPTDISNRIRDAMEGGKAKRKKKLGEKSGRPAMVNKIILANQQSHSLVERQRHREEDRRNALRRVPKTLQTLESAPTFINTNVSSESTAVSRKKRKRDGALVAQLRKKAASLQPHTRCHLSTSSKRRCAMAVPTFGNAPLPPTENLVPSKTISVAIKPNKSVPTTNLMLGSLARDRKVQQKFPTNLPQPDFQVRDFVVAPVPRREVATVDNTKLDGQPQPTTLLEKQCSEREFTERVSRVGGGMWTSNVGKSSEKETAPNYGAGNFVRLNLRNSAGACRGARNKKRRSKASERAKEQRTDLDSEKNPKESGTECCSRKSRGVDELDTFLDSTKKRATTKSASNKVADGLPKCLRHQLPCKLLTVSQNKKGNKGRKFYACSLPRGEQCDFFQWVDDSEQEQVCIWLCFPASTFAKARLRLLTIPELRAFAKKREIDGTGKKQSILARIAVWMRDEVVRGTGEQPDACEDEDIDMLSLASATPGGSSDRSVSSGSSEELDFIDSEEKCPLVRQHPSVKCSTTSSKLLKTLRSVFGHRTFRPGQEWAIQRCMERERSLLVAPTGIGKSLTYALPASLLDGLCVVVSPLVSLMQDQLQKLPPCVSAASLSGQMSRAEMFSTIDDVLRGRIHILFVSPERMSSSSFRRLFARGAGVNPPNVSLLCIDEAHCLSQWAHNFRPSYLRLPSVVKMLQPSSVLAITATAGSRVVNDVSKALQIEESGVKILGNKRDNIDVFPCFMKSQEDRVAKLLNILTVTASDSDSSKDGEDNLNGILSSGSVIVYVWRQKDAEIVAERLQEAGVEGGIVYYHGGMNFSARNRSQNKFMRGKARICVATVAFAMGIDKSDIRGVVHLYLSGSPEHYVQEIGRAGRDGQPAVAVALMLPEEAVVRHSIAHSDLLSEDQVSGMIDLISTQAQGAIKSPNVLGHFPICLTDCSSNFCCKPETAETIVTLCAERTDAAVFEIGGSVFDQVAITPCRRPLREIATKDPIMIALLQCVHQIDDGDGAVQSKPLHGRVAAGLNGLVGKGNGVYTFSVCECCNLLGDNIYPRQVYGFLHSLELKGEVAMVIDPARSLHLTLTKSGQQAILSETHDWESWKTTLFRDLSVTVLTQADRTLDLYFLLRQVDEKSKEAPRSNQTESLPRLSRRLAIFHELCDSYFATYDGGVSNTCSWTPNDIFPKFPGRSMAQYSETVLQYLLQLENSSPHGKEASLRLGTNSSTMFKILTLTKFLHGIGPTNYIVPTETLRQHPLFGKLQSYHFGTVLKGIEDIYRTE